MVVAAVQSSGLAQRALAGIFALATVTLACTRLKTPPQIARLMHWIGNH